MFHNNYEVNYFMNDNNINPDKSNKKTATDNQWISTGRQHPADKTERRDGPGGEDSSKTSKSK
mgnify:CR=1 FL=1